ncbi:hypothetical protein [Acidithiobacillus albertensis]|uniref:hypothetical protein n=1 Tax=Acidithiobacillus albertensis TaxID=119978 RepID=UPI001C06F64A|nr:hypothetical protein [Acidithiobacillus albertensis]MBU2741286.1 hypothetical protein [Acidithiobacillus albertensis]
MPECEQGETRDAIAKTAGVSALKQHAPTVVQNSAQREEGKTRWRCYCVTTPDLRMQGFFFGGCCYAVTKVTTLFYVTCHH